MQSRTAFWYHARRARMMVLVLSSALLLAACGGKPTSSGTTPASAKPIAPLRRRTEQSRLCIFGNNTQAKQCKAGELAYFSPDSWGNEQLPLNVIATFCNTNQPVLFNKSGVICTFTDKRLWLLQPAPAASSPKG